MKSTGIFCVLLLACSLHGGITLVDKGVMKSNIVLSPRAGNVEKHAAAELAHFLRKISQSKTSPAIGVKKVPGKVNITLSVEKNAPCSEEGYILTAGKNSLAVRGRTPLSVLYGVYGLLRSISDIEWVFPGKEGEYFTVSPTLQVTFREKKVNPSFKIRTLSFHAMNGFSYIPDTWDWMVRNHLKIQTHTAIYNHKRFHNFLEKRGASLLYNPCFSNLLSGHLWGPKQPPAIDALFKTHKEYFPLINGKRRKLERQAYQPCTTHKDVIAISSKNLHRLCLAPLAGKKGDVFVYNDDGTGWCQCPNCLKVDSELDKKKHFMSDRFWTFLNAMAEKLPKENKTPLWGMGYQNFQYPPSIKIHPRIKGVNLSFNRLCYRHRIDDKKCLLNPFFLSCYEAWSKKGVEVLGREELGVQGNNFLPAEENYIYLLKYYKKKNFAGTFIAIAPPEANYSPRFRKHAVKQWQSMWQILFYHALYLRDIDADYKKYDEKINSFFYGKGWEGGMREFRKLLKEASNTTPGCFGWGSSSPLGRCLDKPFVHERLKKYLAAAEKAAAKDPDPRALRHVQYDKMRFAETWEKARKNYLENYRSLLSYEKRSSIKIDGILNEADWKNADVISQFKGMKDPRQQAAHQTYLRTCYEGDYLYVALEMAEPFPGKMKTEKRKRDGNVWEDNSVEIFLNHPDMGRSYFQMIFNSDGALFDQKVTPGAGSEAKINLSIEYKVRKNKDSWCLEARIPTAELGHKCFTGQSWKVNVMRVRKLKGEAQDQASTLSGGAPHDVGTFLPLLFAGKRKLTAGFHEDDPRRNMWKNGSFNTVRKKMPAYARSLNLEGGKMPENWFFAHRGKTNGLVALKELENGNKYIRLRASYMNQHFAMRAKSYQLYCRYRGDGAAALYIIRRDKKTHRHIASNLLKIVKAKKGEDWKELRLTFQDSGERSKENQNFSVYVSGTMDFDEIEIQPVK